MMMGFIKNIDEIDIFESFFEPTRQIQSFDANLIKKLYTDKYVGQINKIDTILYRVEKAIEEMHKDYYAELGGSKQKIVTVTNMILSS